MEIKGDCLALGEVRALLSALLVTKQSPLKSKIKTFLFTQAFTEH